ncbi:MAG: MMPL family transporter [Deltaproteobacteria bacterium]|nr:MMPL family transporter [Deltaproteobacteria bacterium]
MEKILKRLGSLACRFHVLTLIALGALTVFSASLVFKIELKTDLMDLLPRNDPSMDRFRELSKEFGSLDNLTIVIASKDKKALDYSALAEDIAKKLTSSGLAEYADYNALTLRPGLLPFTLFLDPPGMESLKNKLTPQGIDEQMRRNKERLLSPLASPLEAEFIASDPLDIRSIVLASLSKDAQNAAASQGYYVSNDASLLLIMVKPSGSYRDIASIKRFRLALAPILQEAVKGLRLKDNPDLSIGLAGPYAIAIEANERLPREVFVNAITSSVLVLLLFKFVFRKRLVAVMLASVTLACALVWTLGAAYLIFGELNMVSSVVTAMLMGLGIDYVVHVFGRCETEYTAGRDLMGAIKTAMEKTAPGVVTGAITTSTAFFSIVITSFQGLHNLGVIAGIGVIACLASTLILLPALMTMTERLRKGLLFSDKQALLGTRVLSRITNKHPGYVIGASVLLILLSATGLGFLRFDSGPEATGAVKSEALMMSERVSRAFDAGMNPLVVTVTGANDADMMERYERMGNALARLKEQGTIRGYASLERFVPPLSKQRATLNALAEARQSEAIDVVRLEKTLKAALQRHGFNLVAADDYSAYAANISAAMKANTPLTPNEVAKTANGKIRHFYNADAIKAVAYVYPNSQKGVWSEGEMTTIEREINGLGNGFGLTGAPIMYSSLKTSIIKESVVASLVSLVLIVLIVYAQFRAIRRAVMVFVPLCAGFLATLGLMGLVGLNFNFINIAAMPLLLGIGIDYGVYIMQDYAENGSSSTILANVGSPVIMCGLTTIAGFGSLATVGFKGIASMGIIIGIGVVACLAGSLLLLPAILAFKEQRAKNQTYP